MEPSTLEAAIRSGKGFILDYFDYLIPVNTSVPNAGSLDVTIQIGSEPVEIYTAVGTATNADKLTIQIKESTSGKNWFSTAQRFSDFVSTTRSLFPWPVTKVLNVRDTITMTFSDLTSGAPNLVNLVFKGGRIVGIKD